MKLLSHLVLGVVLNYKDDRLFVNGELFTIDSD